jgi:hypothetical protein
MLNWDIICDIFKLKECNKLNLLKYIFVRKFCKKWNKYIKIKNQLYKFNKNFLVLYKNEIKQLIIQNIIKILRYTYNNSYKENEKMIIKK